MADFEVIGTHWTVKVNDGHFSETYEIDAPSSAAAVAEATRRWGLREGPRGGKVYSAALSEGHRHDDEDARHHDLVPADRDHVDTFKPAPAPVEQRHPDDIRREVLEKQAQDDGSRPDGGSRPVGAAVPAASVATE